MSDDYEYECDVTFPEVEGKTVEEQLQDFMDYLLLEFLHQERQARNFREKNLGWYALFHERLRDRVQESIRSLFRQQLEETKQWRTHAHSLQYTLKGT